MKRIPLTSSELGFIVLVMALPLGVAAFNETVWGFLGTVVLAMTVGFGIWLSFVFLACRWYDRKRRNEKTRA
jgi:hypothetical protein